MPGSWALTGEVAFGCAMSWDRRHACVAAAGRHVSGRLLTDISPFYDHPRTVVLRLGALNDAHSPLAVAIDPRSEAGTLLRPLSDAGVWVTALTAVDVSVAHGEFLDLVSAGELMHLDQPPLTSAVRAAQQRRLGGAHAWERRDMPVDQCPLEAATFACWAFRRWEEQSQPTAAAL